MIWDSFATRLAISGMVVNAPAAAKSATSSTVGEAAHVRFAAKCAMSSTTGIYALGDACGAARCDLLSTFGKGLHVSVVG